QVAKMVVLAYGLTAVATDGEVNQHFTDVATDNPYYTYIETAYSRGIVSGYGDGSFRPYSDVTRGQVAKIVVQAAGLQLVNPDKPTFSDVPTGSTFYSYIQTAYSNGVLAGYADGTFKP